MDIKWGRRGEMSGELGTNIYTLLMLHMKQTTNENLPQGTGDSGCYSDLNGKEI